MIDQLVKKGLIKTPEIEDTLRQVDRADFCNVNPYADHQQSIGCEAFIDAPYIHAYTLEVLYPYLKQAKKVLDIGTGSGYLAIIFAKIIEKQNEKKERIKQDKIKANKNIKRIPKFKKYDPMQEQLQFYIKTQTSDNNNQKQNKIPSNIEIKNNDNDIIQSVSQSVNDSLEIENIKSKKIYSNNEFLNTKNSIVSEKIVTAQQLDLKILQVIDKENQEKIHKKIPFVSVGLEHIQQLAEQAYANIQKNHQTYLDNGLVNIAYGDGRKGFKDFAPYDVIHVGAGSEKLYNVLVEQLSNNGVMLIPLGNEKDQYYYHLIKKDNQGQVSKTKLMKVNRQPLQSAINQRTNFKTIPSSTTKR